MVVSSVYLMMTALTSVETQSYVYRVKSLGLRQQPCGALVLILNSAETMPLILTTCVLSVRKSKIPLQVGDGTPRSVTSQPASWSDGVEGRDLV